jgi:CRISPR-associated protein Cmr2
MADKYWLSFSLGPVQSFIATARTTRDLWTGSYILSWLTAHAAKVVHESKGEFLEPDITGNPIFRLIVDKQSSDRGTLLTPTLPNRFIVEVDSEYVDTLSESINNTVMAEWRKIADAVRAFLKKTWDTIDPNWDEQWEEQIENCWDIRVSVLPLSTNDVTIAQKLGFKSENHLQISGTSFSDGLLMFKARVFLLGRLDAANKQIRHYPPNESDDCHRPKCALCGERSQQIPQDSRKWDEAAKRTADRGERLTPKDRFCAVELVKRFAWAHYFSIKACFDCDPRERRIWDTYTIAATGWIAGILTDGEPAFECYSIVTNWIDKAEEIGGIWNSQNKFERRQNWNGAWLSWKHNNDDPDTNEFDPCPEPVWRKIEELRARSERIDLSKWPPSYYAILVLDGDKMGEKLRDADPEWRRKISKTLATFASAEVPRIVQNNLGQLIYAGGDDVLAMLPRDRALQCALDLNQSFRKDLPDFTLSGGIAVVHVKHNIHDALDIVRQAENKAKTSGRNHIALSIVRRSSEPETAILSWEQNPNLNDLCKQFANSDVSDRWLYQLEAEWNALEQDPQLLDIEFIRLLNHSTKAPKDAAMTLWNTIAKDSTEECRNALKLMEFASFLARGKED